MSGTSMLDRLAAPGPRGKSVLFAKSGARLHAMLTSAGYDRRTEAGYDWHGLRRGTAPYVLLQHTLSGRGQLRHGGDRHVLQAGETMLLRFPHDHRYWLARGDSWEFFWLCLNGREVLRVWRDAMAIHGPVVRLGQAAIEHLAGIAACVLRDEAASPARASALAYDAAMTLADALLPWGGAQTAGTRPDRIGRAVSLAHTQPGGRLDVATMATTAGYSRHHFSRLFRASEGVSPARYVGHLRMEEAMAAVRSSALPIKTIAQHCGFADPSYFTKVFRRRFGMTPGAFRRSGMFDAQTGQR